MELKDIEIALIEQQAVIDFAKWLVPFLSLLFATIIALLIYIWKQQTESANDILKSLQKNLSKLTIFTSKNETRIDYLEKNQDV